MTEPDAREGVEGFPQEGEQRGHGRLLDVPEPNCQITDLHRAGIRDGDPVDPGFAGRGGRSGSLASGTDPEGDGALHEGPDVGLLGLDILAQEDFRILGIRLSKVTLAPPTCVRVGSLCSRTSSSSSG